MWNRNLKLGLSIFLAILATAAPAPANFRSPFRAGEIPGVSDFQIPNASVVTSPNKNVLRGMEPQTDLDFSDLDRAEVTDVLTFKEDRMGTLPGLFARLRTMNIQSHHVPVGWKGFRSFATPCAHFVNALKVIRDVTADPKRKLYFHCTVGEDRTGALAGLYQLLLNPHSDLDRIFRTEMCENGYEAGNGKKDPVKVVAPIRDPRTGLTPVFLKLAYKIQTGELRWDKLDPATCRNDPALRREFREDARYQLARFRCAPSKKVDWSRVKRNNIRE